MTAAKATMTATAATGATAATIHSAVLAMMTATAKERAIGMRGCVSGRRNAMTPTEPTASETSTGRRKGGESNYRGGKANPRWHHYRCRRHPLPHPRTTKSSRADCRRTRTVFRRWGQRRRHSAFPIDAVCIRCKKICLDVKAVVDASCCARCAKPHGARAPCGLCGRCVCAACDVLRGSRSTSTTTCRHLDNGVAAADIGTVHTCERG